MTKKAFLLFACLLSYLVAIVSAASRFSWGNTASRLAPDSSRRPFTNTECIPSEIRAEICSLDSRVSPEAIAFRPARRSLVTKDFAVSRCLWEQE